MAPEVCAKHEMTEDLLFAIDPNGHLRRSHTILPSTVPAGGRCQSVRMTGALDHRQARILRETGGRWLTARTERR
jgi:hypothetical protein